jgi:multiple sugar transport system permease protein
MFVQPYLLTQGGPNYSTSTIAYYLYVEAFSFYNVGYGSTIAVIGVAVFFIVITIERRLFMVRG